jgi:hypothetical protein
MQEETELKKEIANAQRVVEPSAPSEKVRYGAPNGPRRKRRNCDGREPLDYPGHEAVAQYLATPKLDREFESLTALANRFEVTCVTVHRWKKDKDVMRRTNWLLMQTRMEGDFVARREWPEIMEKAVELAKSGDVQAMKFCESRVWPKKSGEEDSPIAPTIGELFLEEELPVMIPGT